MTGRNLRRQGRGKKGENDESLTTSTVSTISCNAAVGLFLSFPSAQEEKHVLTRRARRVNTREPCAGWCTQDTKTRYYRFSSILYIHWPDGWLYGVCCLGVRCLSSCHKMYMKKEFRIRCSTGRNRRHWGSLTCFRIKK